MTTGVKKEPLYKKWWMWIGLFLIVATIVNGRERANNAKYESDAATIGTVEEPADVEVSTPPARPENVFLVGEDIEPGEYFIVANEGQHGYLQLSRDDSNSVASIITNKNFATHSFITVKSGEYLTIERASIYPAAEADVPTLSDGVLTDGVFRVGKDIPAGEHSIIPTSTVAGYFQLSTCNRGESDHIIANQNFSTPIVISMEEGQYLTLTRAEIRK